MDQAPFHGGELIAVDRAAPKQREVRWKFCRTGLKEVAAERTDRHFTNKGHVVLR